MNLSDLVAAEGVGFMIDSNPGSLDTAMGKSDPDHCCMQDLGGGVFAIASDSNSIIRVYSASHEIAELKHGFKHSEEMFSEQSAILSRWCKMLSAERDSVAGAMELGLRNADLCSAVASEMAGFELVP